MARSSDQIALLGATGQLGFDIARVAKSRGINILALRHEDADVTNPKSLEVAFSKTKPSIVINCAAFHQVDRCEEDPDQAFHVNAIGALNVARTSALQGAKCVHISTDYVFPGDKLPRRGATTPENSYMESEKPDPANVYGTSKLAGEHLVAMIQQEALIIRVASLFGVAGSRGKGRNFIETILAKARAGDQVRVVDDQYMTPTYTKDAADAILQITLMNISGILHVVNPAACTWHDFALKAVELVGLKTEVQPVASSSYPTKAKRPRNSALNSDKLASLLGRPLRTWEEALRAYLAEKGYI